MYIRKPVVAGSFYPGETEKLKKLVSTYLSSAANYGDRSDSDRVVGIVSPHAGYIYSGPVAAYGFNSLAGSSLNSFVVIAPSHRGRFNGASVIPEGMYRTPLGDVRIDSSIAGEMEKKENFAFIKEAHEYEHSLEVQIPFLQMIKPDAVIVPVIMGTVDLDLCMKIGKTIADTVKSSGKNYGVIISTDLSHYYSYDEAVKKDGKFIEALELFDEKKLKEVIKSGKAEACGEGSVMAGLTLCRELGATGVKILKYANSGDTAGPKDQVVGYVSASVLKR
jgi:AmmeMemoRadiSam system protein B